MKKTLQTAMTAAMFAASLGMAAGTASASQAGESGAAAVEKLMNATAGEVVDVYGPPEAFYTETEPLSTTTETTAPPEETTDPYYDEPVTGGVVPLPTMDLDGNGQLNACDLTILKQYMLQDPKPAHGFDFTYSSDYNFDGILDKQDLIQMILVIVQAENNVISPCAEKAEHDPQQGNIDVIVRILSGLLCHPHGNIESCQDTQCHRDPVERDLITEYAEGLDDIRQVDSQIREVYRHSLFPLV